MTHYSATLGFFLTAILLLCSSCAQYKVCTHHLSPESKESLTCHRLYQVIPRHRCQIRWYDVGHWMTWMLFGNDDDGIFGEAQNHPYKENKKNNFGKAFQWWLRNPLHNFTFYTVGSAHRKNSEFIFLKVSTKGIRAFQYYPCACHNFGGKGTSLLFALHGGKPFVSFRLAYPGCYQSQFYLGWRKEGNFGIKIHPLNKK